MNDLLKSAQEAQKNAHAPYSQCRIGAAVRTEDGLIFAGCNVENASYGATICAERNAIFQAIAKGQKKIKELLLTVEGDQIWPPCGMCRQVLVEFADADTPIHCHCSEGSIQTHRLGDLMPHAFNADFL